MIATDTNQLAKEAISLARRSSIFTKFGQTGKIKHRDGDSVRFFNYGIVMPSPRHPLDAVIKEYAECFLMPKCYPSGREPNQEDILHRVAKSIRQMMESAIASTLSSQGAQVYASGATAVSGIVTPAQVDDLKEIAKYLSSHGVDEITEIVDPDEEYVTKSVNACYVGLVPTACVADIKAMAGFESIDDYEDEVECPRLDKKEFGRIGNLRFIKIPNYLKELNAGGTNAALDSDTNVNVYTIIIMGSDAYGVVPFDADVTEPDKDYGTRINIVEDTDKPVEISWAGSMGARGFDIRYVCYRCGASLVVTPATVKEEEEERVRLTIQEMVKHEVTRRIPLTTLIVLVYIFLVAYFIF